MLLPIRFRMWVGAGGGVDVDVTRRAGADVCVNQSVHTGVFAGSRHRGTGTGTGMVARQSSESSLVWLLYCLRPHCDHYGPPPPEVPAALKTCVKGVAGERQYRALLPDQIRASAVDADGIAAVAADVERVPLMRVIAARAVVCLFSCFHCPSCLS